MRINEMTPKITLGQTVYNPEMGAFEAQAELHEAGARFSYRARFRAAPQTDFHVVTCGLKAQALACHHAAQERTQKLIRDTVRAAITRTRVPALDATAGRHIGAFLSA